MKVEDHRKQIRRIRADADDIRANAGALSELRVISQVMVPLELVTFGFGVFHLLHLDFFAAMIALAIEGSLAILHISGMSFERLLHRRNSERLDRLRNECRDKAADLLNTASAFNIWAGRWYLAMRARLQAMA